MWVWKLPTRTPSRPIPEPPSGGPVAAKPKSNSLSGMKSVQALTFITLLGIGLCGVSRSRAGIIVHGSTPDYQETGGDWHTMGTNDIDGDGGLGRVLIETR